MITDDEIRAIWCSKGGYFHGHLIKIATMQDEQLLLFLRELMTLPERSMLVQPDLIKVGSGKYPENVWKSAQRLAYKLANLEPLKSP